MNIYSLSSCCGIGEISDLLGRNIWGAGRVRYEAAIINGDVDFIVAEIIKKRDGSSRRGKYPIIITATPDKEEYWIFHIAFALAGFIPVAKGDTLHTVKPKYKNILWVFQRN